MSGGVQGAGPNGFTRGTEVHPSPRSLAPSTPCPLTPVGPGLCVVVQVHHFEKGQINPAALLRSMHPSQARYYIYMVVLYMYFTRHSLHVICIGWYCVETHATMTTPTTLNTTPLLPRHSHSSGH